MLHETLSYLFPNAKPGDWLLQDDGAGPYIKAWRRIEEQPSQTLIDANTNAASKFFYGPPTPMQQIRALEQANDDSQRKLNRQAAIDTALTIASRNPAAAGMTRDQVHAAYYASNRGYKSMVDLEAACAALRKLIVV